MMMNQVRCSPDVRRGLVLRLTRFSLKKLPFIFLEIVRKKPGTKKVAVAVTSTGFSLNSQAPIVFFLSLLERGGQSASRYILYFL
jgi:hypothetical protein